MDNDSIESIDGQQTMITIPGKSEIFEIIKYRLQAGGLEANEAEINCLAEELAQKQKV